MYKEHVIEDGFKNNINFSDCIKNDTLINDDDHIQIDLVLGILGFKNINFTNKFYISYNNIKYIDYETGYEKEILIDKIDNNEKIINKLMFKNCKFNDDFTYHIDVSYRLETTYCDFKSVIFEALGNSKDSKHNKYDIQFNKSKIQKLKIKYCKLFGRFYINNQKNNTEKMKIDSVEIEESTFNENFKLHYCEIKKLKIDSVDFKKNADFFKSIFLNGNNTENEDKKNYIIFNGINIDGLTIFEECEFHNKFILKYVTFNGLAQFRRAKFFKGIDLDRTNSEKEMNFFGVNELDNEESIIETSQETYRIIKYNCERIGSIIDANKYHALELKKRKEELSNYVGKDFNKIFLYDNDPKEYQGSWADWVVFKINWHSSRFGTSWGLAFLWIIIIGFLTSMFMKTGNYYSFEYIFEYVNKWELFKEILADTPKYMSIINGDELKEYSVAFLLNKVLLGYLYYQFVTAVRKDTRK